MSLQTQMAIRSAADVQLIHEQFIQIETFTDFLEWLFDESGELDHITQSEAWERFEKWQDEQGNTTPLPDGDEGGVNKK